MRRRIDRWRERVRKCVCVCEKKGQRKNNKEGESKSKNCIIISLNNESYLTTISVKKSVKQQQKTFIIPHYCNVWKNQCEGHSISRN